MNISKIYIGSKTINDEALNDLIGRAKNRDIPVFYMKEDPIYFKIIPDINKNVTYNYPKNYKASDLSLLSSEITKALDAECYLAALSLSLTVPSVIGKFIYPELNEKEAYIKCYQVDIGKYETCKENLNEKIPYPSGELVYSLKNAIQNNWNTLVTGKYQDFELTGLRMLIQDKSFYDMYTSSVCVGKNFNGVMNSELEISIRDFCGKMLTLLSYETKEHPDLLNKHDFSLRYFDKELDELQELNLQSNKCRKS